MNIWIEKVYLEPKEPQLEEQLRVMISIRNMSSEKASVTVNAMLDSRDPSFPTAIRQAQVELEEEEYKEAHPLFELIVDRRRFLPGRYKVQVWLAGQRNIIQETEFEIKPDDHSLIDF